tara:strand:- start:933 stop:1562 length:630 start_codon:yes stop_codon:yes gene_type:complete
MAYIGTQPNNVKKNIGLYTPSEILQLTKDGSWGGSLELIQSQTFSGVSSVAFTDIKQNVYDVHFIKVKNFTQDGGNSFGMRFLLSNDGGSSYETSNYQMSYFEITPDGNNSENRSTSRTHFQNTIVTQDRDSTPLSIGGGYYYLYNAGNSSKFTTQTGHTVSGISSVIGFSMGGASYNVAETINAFKFDDFGLGYNLYGTIELYGVKQI